MQALRNREHLYPQEVTSVSSTHGYSPWPGWMDTTKVNLCCGLLPRHPEQGLSCLLDPIPWMSSCLYLSLLFISALINNLFTKIQFFLCFLLISKWFYFLILTKRLTWGVFDITPYNKDLCPPYRTFASFYSGYLSFGVTSYPQCPPSVWSQVRKELLHEELCVCATIWEFCFPSAVITLPHFTCPMVFKHFPLSSHLSLH